MTCCDRPRVDPFIPLGQWAPRSAQAGSSRDRRRRAAWPEMRVGGEPERLGPRAAGPTPATPSPPSHSSSPIRRPADGSTSASPPDAAATAQACGPRSRRHQPSGAGPASADRPTPRGLAGIPTFPADHGRLRHPRHTDDLIGPRPLTNQQHSSGPAAPTPPESSSSAHHDASTSRSADETSSPTVNAIQHPENPPRSQRYLAHAT
jgi:hypothetical protein